MLGCVLPRLGRQRRRQPDHPGGTGLIGDLPDPVLVGRLRAAGCVFAEDEARVLHDAARDGADLESLLARRIAGEPLEQVVGWALFCGVRVAVAEGVFVPRRRTEFLVARAVALQPRTVLDLCCGTGAIAVALRAALGPIEVHAADVDPAAVACARRNVGGPVYQGDLYDPLPRELAGRVDVLVVNAPYVPTESIALMPREARLHEAPVALDGGTDGVDVQRRVIAGARNWLAPNGHLLIETSARQAPLGVRACREHGLSATVAHDDAYDATVLVARIA